MTLQRELEVLRSAFPVKSGMRIRRKAENANRHARAATLYVYLESSSGGGRHYAIHQTMFAKRSNPSSRWWSDYFAHRVVKGWKSGGTSVQRDGILEGGIIPKVNIRTGKIWHVRAIIGYVLHDNWRAIHTAFHSRGD